MIFADNIDLLLLAGIIVLSLSVVVFLLLEHCDDVFLF